MKKLITSFLVFLLIGIAAQAQSKAYIDTKNAKTVVNERLVSYTFTVDNVLSDLELQALQKKFKSTKMISSISSELTSGNKAKFSVALIKKEHRKTLQSMFLNGGIKMLVIDEVDVPTTNVIEYLNAQKKK